MTNKEAIEELKNVDTLDMPARLCEAHYMSIKALEQAVPIPENATRKEVHLLIFGIEPPELDSPYYACARSNGGCNACKHKDDTDCDYNWWNAPYWYRESAGADMRSDTE